MHVLMLSMDTSILTQNIGNSRERHALYAEQAGLLTMVICNRRSPALGAYQSDRVIAYPTHSRSYLHYLWDGYRMGLKFQSARPIDMIAAQDPFLTGLIGLMLRRRLHVPLILQDHSSLVDNCYFAAENPRNRWLQRLARWTLHRADAVRVVNHQERLACMRHGVAADRLCVIPVAPDLVPFLTPPTDAQINRWREQLHIGPQTPVILWVGRLVPVKNVPLLLRAFRRVQAELGDARLIMVTDRAGTALSDAIAGIASSVSILSAVARADLPALYATATVYAHSSNYEGFGLVLAEAAAAGLPAVSTATDGAQEIIIEGQTGRLVPIGDEAAMAQALLDLLRDPAQCRTMGDRARQHIQDAFDEQRLMNEWIEMWRAVGEKRSPCAS